MDFESGEVDKSAIVERLAIPIKHFSEATMFHSEIITMDFFSSVYLLNPPAIIMMDNSIIYFYQEAIAKNSVN